MARMQMMRKRFWMITGGCLAWLMALLGFTISGCSSSLDDTVMPAYGVPYSSSSASSSSAASGNVGRVQSDVEK